VLLTLGGSILYSRLGKIESSFATEGLGDGFPGRENVRGNLTA